MTRTMRLLLLVILLLAASGCASNFYNVPKETFEKKVRILGVAPVMLDAGSDIRYPEKEALVKILGEFNRNNSRELVGQMKSSGTFFLVQQLPDDPDQLFSTLFFRREKRDDAGIIYNKYFFKTAELKEVIEKNRVDALLVVVMSGITKHGRRYSSNLMDYLESDYNNLIMTAQVVDSEGTILWEYPNFRASSPSMPTFLTLQYADFDEATANETDNVLVHFKTLDGIRRALSRTTTSTVLSNADVSARYAGAFDEMAVLLKPQSDFFTFGEKKKDSATTGQAPTPASASAPASSPASPAR